MVGAVQYYSNESDALTQTNMLGSSGVYVVDGAIYGFNAWRLASNSTGTSPQDQVYMNGIELEPDGNYFLYPAAPCFLEGTGILCNVDDKDVYMPIESLKPGMLVKTSLDGYKKIELIGKGTIFNPGNTERIEDRLYKCSPTSYPGLNKDLYITGCHSILVRELSEVQRTATTKYLGRIFVTDKKYRLMACVDERAEPWNSEGVYTIWHIALENNDPQMNYGIYAEGLLVESCSINFLKKKSNMTMM
jgi:hypothetical protein